MKYTFLITAIIVLNCCWGPKNSYAMKNNGTNGFTPNILNGNYHITSLNLKDVSIYNLEISFKDSSEVSGFAGCNRFFGTYSYTSHGIKIEPLAATRKMCGAITIETELITALHQVDSISVSDLDLTLFHKKKPLLVGKKIVLQQLVGFEYKATSRGGYTHIEINQDTIAVTNEIDSKPNKTVCKPHYWKKLNSLLSTIAITNLPNLKPPSTQFQFDGAPIANLEVVFKSGSFTTPSFDHGNPPKEIEALVKEILSCSENIE